MSRVFSSSVLLSALVLLVLLPSVACASAEDGVVRVGLTQCGTNLKQITISSSLGSTDLSYGDTTTSCKGPVSVDTADGRLVCKADGEPLNAGSVVTLSPAGPNAFLVVSNSEHPGRKYRGTIEVSATPGGLKLVNVIPVDDYLKGVLPAEIGSGAPEEALRAQAIVARTYAISSGGKHSAQGYELCDTTCCQLYNGVDGESEACNKAIADTAGELIYYGDEVAQVFYSTDCGGVTQSYEEAYKKPLYPYLSAVQDPCELKHQAWEQSFKLPDLGAKLVKAGVKEAEDIQSIRISEQGPSGRVQSLEVTGKSGTTTITSSKLRAALGYDVVKSNLFTMESGEGGTIVIKGKGWGHGLGLCQTGAIQLAKAPHGYTCEKILAHYFPGTRIALPGAESPSVALASAAPKISAVQDIPTIKTTSAKPVQSGSSAQPPAKSEDEKRPVPFQVRVNAPGSL